ncbi:MAG: ABC-F family ATP-binding cassette domain-containing protein [Candidatus Dependentiae bacterium]|nr:ABC-F family ATP-binding cassette domain-containing protein [Candidatus Dependentiae bacterium]
MMHKPILLKNIGFSFPHKICFEDFTGQINYGSSIAIIGRNGSGKSTLLNILRGTVEPTSGQLVVPSDVVCGYVPQIVEDFDNLSGGQRFNQALTGVLSEDPNVLLLDEPTNHLDQHNRTSLMRMLRSYQGTLIVVTHDVELLRTCIDTLWHIDNGRIQVFSGNYDDYMREMNIKRAAIEEELARLNRQKQGVHQVLMKEQERAAKSKVHGQKKYAHEKIALRAAEGRGQKTHNKMKKSIADTKGDLLEQLSELRLPEEIVPTFSLSSADVTGRTLVSIVDGSVGYLGQEPLLKHISLQVGPHDRIAIMGANGSGKSTLMKAILGDVQVATAGDWYMPKAQDIGYLDQQYRTLDADKTVFETIQDLVPTHSHAEIRRHLNDFLFRKNEEVNTLVANLSGGEKARLTLAQIAAKTPRLLMLDEITNNLDLETREHVIEVLKEYPGAMMVISHDEDFLKEIGVTDEYYIENGSMVRR